MKEMMKEMLQGLMYAIIILFTLFVHVAWIIDVPEFRYVGF